MRAAPHHDVVVIGAGPAGCAVARLLASWGHRVAVLNRPRSHARGQIESIPPSARKLFQAVGVFDAVARRHFPSNRGNAVWWGLADGRHEDFDVQGASHGLQVFRPDFDALLVGEAAAAGAHVICGVVRAVSCDRDDWARVDYEPTPGSSQSVRARFVVDASGRSGVLARRGLRRYDPTHRMQAYFGFWRNRCDGGAWPGDHGDRTLVETYDDGWAWSLASGPSGRQVAVMVDAATTRTSRGPLAGAYVAELSKTRHVRSTIAGATLERIWACDASMYTATAMAGPRFLLVGDAACCIDPLSSFGVKKSLASGWLGAVALHTALIDPSRSGMAFEHFTRREHEVYAAEGARTREYARLAAAHHHHPFWTTKASGAAVRSVQPDGDTLLRAPHVSAAYERVRRSDDECWRWNDSTPLVPCSVVRGNEIVVEEAVRTARMALRYAEGVDIVALGRAAQQGRTVSDLFEAYCRHVAPVPVTSFLRALSWLIAERIVTSTRAGADRDVLA